MEEIEKSSTHETSQKIQRIAEMRKQLIPLSLNFFRYDQDIGKWYYQLYIITLVNISLEIVSYLNPSETTSFKTSILEMENYERLNPIITFRKDAIHQTIKNTDFNAWEILREKIKVLDIALHKIESKYGLSSIKKQEKVTKEDY